MAPIPHVSFVAEGRLREGQLTTSEKKMSPPEEKLSDANPPLQSMPRKTISRSKRVFFHVGFCDDKIDLFINQLTSPVLSLALGGDASTLFDYRKDIGSHLVIGENHVCVVCHNGINKGRCSFDIEFEGQPTLSWDVFDTVNKTGTEYREFFRVDLRIVVVRD